MTSMKHLQLQTVSDFMSCALLLCALFNRIFITGELVMAIARGVGLLVAIVAVLVCFMIMMVARALIAYMIHKWGVTGVTVIVGVFVYLAVRYGNMSTKMIWTFLRKSCS